GVASVQLPVAGDDHRPERMQRWQPALGPSPACTGGAGRGDGSVTWGAGAARAALWPPWLLRPPKRLAQQGERPCLRGQTLRLLAGPERVESGWWEGPAELGDGQGLVRRDYFVAHNDAAGWVWIYRDRASG